MDTSYYVYILASGRNGTLYIGVTNNLGRRHSEHKTGTLKGFSARYGIKQLVYFEMHDHISEAIAREKVIKKWRRAWKLELIEKINPEWQDLSAELTL